MTLSEAYQAKSEAYFEAIQLSVMDSRYSETKSEAAWCNYWFWKELLKGGYV